MLVNHQTIMRYITEHRIIHIDGRFGGGKTALAMRLALELVENYGFRYIFTNFNCVFNDVLDAVELREDKYVDAVLILDEAGVFLNKKSDWDDWDAFPRKLNVVILAPSAKSLPSTSQIMTIERIANYQPVLIDMWRYEAYQTSGRKKYSYKFDWWFPHEIFGLYSTDATPIEASLLKIYLQKWLAMRKVDEQAAEISAVPIQKSGLLSS